MTPTYLSLFSGIGGLDLGLDRAGWRCVGQVERDPFCRSVLARHWPEVPRHDDVRTAVEWWRSGDRPVVRMVVGGFPCQGHSVAGKQRGTADERWGWPWFRAVVEAVRPPWVLIENVPNLVRTGLDVVLRELAELGFDAWWGCVPAAAVGAPHLRWRLFVIASDAERIELRQQPGWELGPDREGPPVVGHDGTRWALAYAERQPRGARRLGDAGQGPRGWDADRSRFGPDVADPASVRGDSGPGLRESGARSSGSPGVVGAVAEDCGRVLADPGGEGPPASEPAALRAEGRWDQGGATSERGWWTTEPDVGRVAHGVPARVDRLRALGNAVVPQVAEHIGRLILAADREVSGG